MNISLKLLETNSQIQESISQALLGPANIFMNNAIGKLKQTLPPIVENAIKNSQEYVSLLNGILRYEFGIPDPNTRLLGLLNIWTSNIEFNYISPVISSRGIKSSVTVKMIRINFEDVLYSEFAEIQDNLRGYSLPWLRWLLLEGDKTLVADHEVIIGPSKFSRTGNAIMKKNSGKQWRVPSEFSGTEKDNWITRSLDSIQPEIESILQKAFKS